MVAMEVFALAVLVAFLSFSSYSHGLPVTSCPKYKGNFYIADHVNKCVYYWCLSGKMLGGAQQCPQGSGVPSFHRSNRNPCIISVTSCSIFGQVPGMEPSTPPPTTRKNVDPDVDPQVSMATDADVSMTTESLAEMSTADVSTAEMSSPEVTADDTTTDAIVTSATDSVTEEMTSDYVETTDDDVMTTDDVTGDPGSGEDDDLLPVDVTTTEPSDGSGQFVFEVFADTSIDGGLQIADTPSLAQCLQACSFLGAACAGLDYDPTIEECHIHTEGTECGTMITSDNATHVRLLAC